MVELEYHELADIFPLIRGDAYEALVEDIRQNGLLEYIVLYEGKILDGRNRYRACWDLGITPSTVDYTGDYPLSHVISLNVRRRHLSPSQSAIVASHPKVLGQLEAEAQLRSKAGTPAKKLEGGKSVEHAAAAFETNNSYVTQGKAVRTQADKEQDNTMLNAVAEGRLPIPQAYALTKVTASSIRNRALKRVLAEQASVDRTKAIIREEGPAAKKPVAPPKNTGGEIAQIAMDIVNIRTLYKAVTSATLMDKIITHMETTIADMKLHRKGLPDD